MATLRLLTGPQTLESFTLTAPVVIIGRTRNNTLRLEDRSVSKHHVLLVDDDGQHRLFDLHSTNGTLVNGQRILTTVLNPGDQVQIGEFILGYEAPPPRATQQVTIPANLPTVTMPAPTPVPVGPPPRPVLASVTATPPTTSTTGLLRPEPAPPPPPPTPEPVAPVVAVEPSPVVPPPAPAPVPAPLPVPIAPPVAVLPHAPAAHPPTPVPKKTTAEGSSFIRMPPEKKPAEAAPKAGGLVGRLFGRDKPAAAPAPAPAAPTAGAAAAKTTLNPGVPPATVTAPGPRPALALKPTPAPAPATPPPPAPAPAPVAKPMLKPSAPTPAPERKLGGLGGLGEKKLASGPVPVKQVQELAPKPGAAGADRPLFGGPRQQTPDQLVIKKPVPPPKE